MKIMFKAAVIAVPLALAASGAGADTFVRMVAGPAGGSWYPLGAKIMQLLEKDVSGIRTSNGPGGGVGNVKKVNKGGADLGWTFGFTAYDGWVGRDAFDKKPQKNIRFFSTLFPGVLQTAVPGRSKINSYADLKNRNISPGKTVFSGNVTVRRLLPLYGFNYNTIKKNGGAIHRVGYKDSVALMKDGHIDAFVGLTSVPNSSFISLAFKPGIRFLPIGDAIADKFVKQNPGFWKTKIPAGSYQGQDKDVQTLATATVLVISSKISNDLAYKMIGAFWKNHAQIQKVHGTWKNVQMKTALSAATIPLHPGVAKYYKEHGISK